MPVERLCLRELAAQPIWLLASTFDKNFKNSIGNLTTEVVIQQRDEILLDLLDLNPTSDNGIFKRILLKLNRYMILAPNIIGIGIDFNKIFEDLIGKDNKFRRKQD